MKTTTLILALAAGLCLSASAQSPYSQNIVGYYNKLLPAGDKLIGNQLSISNNLLADIFGSGVPEGSTFAKWDAGAARYLPASVYQPATGWSIAYSLTYGEGGLFHTPVTFTNTFVGEVWPGFNPEGAPFAAPLVSSNGLFLLSCVIPLGNATFEQTVGREPWEGEWMRMLDASSQTWVTSTFRGGAWDHGAPMLGLGDAAFFSLGTAFVPEPATGGLLGLGLLLLTMARGKRQ